MIPLFVSKLVVLLENVIIKEKIMKFSKIFRINMPLYEYSVSDTLITLYVS